MVHVYLYSVSSISNWNSFETHTYTHRPKENNTNQNFSNIKWIVTAAKIPNFPTHFSPEFPLNKKVVHVFYCNTVNVHTNVHIYIRIQDRSDFVSVPSHRHTFWETSRRHQRTSPPFPRGCRTIYSFRVVVKKIK